MRLQLLLALCGPPLLGCADNAPSAVNSLVRATFSAASDDVPNPARGFYAFTDDLRLLDAGELDDLHREGVRLIYCPVRLDAFRDVEIPEAELALMDDGLSTARASGLDVILRFAYNYPETEDDYLNAKDAALSRVEAHIAQLAPLLQAHSDVVVFWQAGFIGAWGEWHTSSSGLDSADAKDAVLEALLTVLPPDSFLQLRYPADLVRALDGEPPSGEEFTATPRARLGFHNDCFLASDTDVGTFELGLEDPARDFIASVGRVAPVGGETCNAQEDTGQRRSCAAILEEGQRYGFTYLNRDYYSAFLDNWQEEGCLDDVSRSLGYRLEPASVEHPPQRTLGGSVTLQFVVKNTGWARPFVGRRLEVHLTDGAGLTHTITTGIDSRSLTPGEHTLAVKLNPDVQAGSYAVSLGFPHTDPRRALRFAVTPDASRGQALTVSGMLVTGTSIAFEAVP
jgi:hypothetical protein